MTILISYGIVIGTAILLTSWIVEKYITAYWDDRIAEVNEIRSIVYQELLLAQSDANFLSYQGDSTVSIEDLNTTEEAVEAFLAYRTKADLLSPYLPERRKGDLESLNLQVDQLLEILQTELDDNSSRNLSEEEKILVNGLNSIAKTIISLMESMLATDNYYEAGTKRMQSMLKVSQLLPNKAKYRTDIEKILASMNEYKMQVYNEENTTVSPVVLINSLYEITNKLIEDINAYSSHVLKSRSLFSNVYKTLYVIGSVILLLSVILK